MEKANDLATKQLFCYNRERKRKSRLTAIRNGAGSSMNSSRKKKEEVSANPAGNAARSAGAAADITARTGIRKKDWIAALVILAAAGCLLLVFQMTKKQTGNYAEVRIDGALYGSYPLDQEKVFTIETDYGKNVIEIQDGAVSVTDADCDGHDCMRQGKIRRCSETIVCLPHKMVIEITRDRSKKEDKTDFDTVAS